MRDQELEQRLRTAVEHAAPDPLDHILSSCRAQKGTVIPMTTQKKKRWAPLAIVAALLVMCTGVFGLEQWQTANAVASVVSLDVNPSIQLQVNRNEKVLSADAMNADAEVILEGMELNGTQLNVAVNAIVGSLLQHGYLDRISSAILISVEDNDAQRASRLESALTEEVNAALENASARAAVLSQTMTYDAELESEAASNSVSVGKAALIQQVQALNGALEFSDLAKLSVEELREMRESGAEALPIGLAAAAYAAEEYAGTLAVDAVTWEADPELDETPPHYEVKLKHPTLGKFEYLVDAYTGEVLKGTADILSLAPSSGGDTTSSAIITESKARSIALDHAGVSSGSAQDLQIKLTWKDGVQIYKIEFRVDRTEYEYEVNAADGTIRKAEHEDHSNTQSGSNGTSGSTASYIGEAAARKAALAHAGITESGTYYCNAWVEYDDGHPDHYEVEFRAGNIRYEYEVDLYSGAILSYEQEDTGSGKVSGDKKPSVSTDSFIGEDAAKTAAFRHAGVSSSDVSKLKCKLDEDDGAYLYEVEFTAGNTEYEYEIDAVSGKVLKFEQDAHGKSSAPASVISESEAKSIALQDAGVKESGTSGMKCKLDEDDGSYLYEIEFTAGNTEYEYEIDAVSGKILKAEQDTHGNASASASVISESKAKSIALQDAGVSESAASKLKCKLDEDDGSRLYEIEFQVGKTEYEYEIDAVSGKILKAEIDADD